MQRDSELFLGNQEKLSGGGECFCRSGKMSEAREKGYRIALVKLEKLENMKGRNAEMSSHFEKRISSERNHLNIVFNRYWPNLPQLLTLG